MIEIRKTAVAFDESDLLELQRIVTDRKRKKSQVSEEVCI